MDGGTVDLRIDLGFKVCIEERCCLLGIDTPETRIRDQREKRFGKMATARVKELLLEGSKHVVQTSFDSPGKFGRAIVDFQFPGGETLRELLVAEHLVVPYAGQSKNAIRALHEKHWERLERS